MKLRSFLQDLPVWLYVFFLATLIGATVYQMMVIVPEFTREMPASMIALANSPVKPSNFWASPLFSLSIMLLPIIAIIANWKTPRRKYLLLCFVFVFATSICTSIYFIPRLRIMGLMDVPPTTDIDLLIVTIREWVFADQLRCWLLAVPSFLLALKSATISTKKEPAKRVVKKVPARNKFEFAEQ